MRSGQRSCRRWSLAADRSSAPSPTVPLIGRDSTLQPGSKVRRRSILLPVAHSSSARTVRQHPATACRNAAGAGMLPG